MLWQVTELSMVSHAFSWLTATFAPFPVFRSVWFAKPMACNRVAFAKTTGITKMMKMTMTCETPGQRYRGLKTPNPKTPWKKQKKLPPPGLDPKLLKKNSKNTKKYLKNTLFRVFLVFFEYVLRNLGSGAQGVIFYFFFQGISGFGVLSPCSWPGVSQTMTTQTATNERVREAKNIHDHHRKKIFWGTFLASIGEIQKGTGGRGRDRKLHKLSWRLSQIVVTSYDDLWRLMTFYDVLCQWNKESGIIIKCCKLS